MTEKRKHRFIRLTAWLCALIMAGAAVFAPMADEPPDGFDSWEDYFNSMIYDNQEEEIQTPSLQEMKKAAENDRFRLLLHEDGLDFYIEEKETGRVWGSALHPDQSKLSNKNKEEVSALLELNIVGEDEAIKSLTLTDINSSDFDVTIDTLSNGIAFQIEETTDEIAFTLEITLEEDGFTALIPEGSVKESGKGKLLSLHLLPSFGATEAGQDGYVFYPDGSGALIPLREHSSEIAKTYTFPFYGTSVPDLADLKEREEQNIRNLMLPVFGINSKKGGFFAVASAGDANASLNMSVSDLYRVWFQFDWRMYTSAEFNYTGTAFGGGSINKLLPDRIEGDRSVRVFLLTEGKSTYSDMANVYRDYLQKTGVLTQKIQQDDIPLSLEVLMSVTASGMLGDTLRVMTTFGETEDMLKELQDSGVKTLETRLKGWSSGGYEAKPTAQGFESALGGISNAKKLMNAAKETGNLYWEADYLTGDAQKGSFNQKKDVLRNLLGAPITDKDKTQFLLNPFSILQSRVAAWCEKQPETYLCLTDVGSRLLPNLYEKDPYSRTETKQLYTEILKKLKEKQGIVSLTGGNAYVLPYADRLYDLPDSDSDYYQNGSSVPFYQMVVHGWISYSSLAGNLSEDLQRQKLKWVETGSVPHFVITKQPTSELKDTGYNRLFSSEFSLWKEKMVKVSEEFNQRLSSVWNAQMIRHEWLSESLVKITYENGNAVWINYGEKEVSLDGITVPAMDYVVGKEKAK